MLPLFSSGKRWNLLCTFRYNTAKVDFEKVEYLRSGFPHFSCDENGPLQAHFFYPAVKCIRL